MHYIQILGSHLIFGLLWWESWPYPCSMLCPIIVYMHVAQLCCMFFFSLQGWWCSFTPYCESSKRQESCWLFYISEWDNDNSFPYVSAAHWTTSCTCTCWYNQIFSTWTDYSVSTLLVIHLMSHILMQLKIRNDFDPVLSPESSLFVLKSNKQVSYCFY